MSIRSRQSARTVRIQRSAKAFAFGAWIARADHLDPFRPEDLVERAAELGVAIMDEKPERLLIVEIHGEVARLLGDPTSVRVRAARDVLDPPGRERDEEENVDSLQEDGLDGEEVAGERARRLRSQKGSPRRMRSLWRRLETGLEQHLAHRGCRNRDAETFELADDPLVSPVRVLTGESQDQLAERALQRRSPRRPVRVRPPTGDELAGQRSSVSGLNEKAA